MTYYTNSMGNFYTKIQKAILEVFMEISIIWFRDIRKTISSSKIKRVRPYPLPQFSIMES